MRIKLLVCVLLCSFGAAAAPAGAVTFGISENQDSMFSNPLFDALSIKHTRLVVSHDVVSNAAADGGDELRRVQRYFDQANARGVKVLVAFNHSRGDWRLCKRKSNRSKLAVCKLPSVSAYRANVKAFLARFSPESISPWNEINHASQPTSRSPKRAAQYTKVVRKLFRGPVVEGDFLDFKFSRRYAAKFRRALGRSPRICGLHNYVDVNRKRSTGTKAMMRALRCKKYWWTETGGQYKSVGLKPNQTRQSKATKQMFRLARKFRGKTQRVYNYSFFGRPTDVFDGGLVDSRTGKARKAYRAFKKGLKK